MYSVSFITCLDEIRLNLIKLYFNLLIKMYRVLYVLLHVYFIYLNNGNFQYHSWHKLCCLFYLLSFINIVDLERDFKNNTNISD